MRLGVDVPKEWKKLSDESGLGISDIAYAYMLEQLIFRIGTGKFQEHLWLMNQEALGIAAYGKNAKGRIGFFYAQSGRRVLQESPMAGHPLSRSVIRMIAEELFSEREDGITWNYRVEERPRGFRFVVEGSYLHMKVPFAVTIDAAPEMARRPMVKELNPILPSVSSCMYYAYSAESVLAEQLFEILDKLELLSEMTPYALANDILKDQTISGRHITEDFKLFADKSPKTVSMKRLEQLEQYKTYAYMKRKWQQYEKRNRREPEEWDVVLGRVLAFLRPTWSALCENEIFFDDWMPELERFLG